MRSTEWKVRIPNALELAFEERIKELPYSSRSAYFLGLGIYDLVTRRPHKITGYLTKFSLEEQDRIHDEIARAFKAGEIADSTYFERTLAETVEKLSGKNPPEESKVIDLFFTRLAKGRA